MTKLCDAVATSIALKPFSFIPFSAKRLVAYQAPRDQEVDRGAGDAGRGAHAEDDDDDDEEMQLDISDPELNAELVPSLLRDSSEREDEE